MKTSTMLLIAGLGAALWLSQGSTGTTSSPTSSTSSGTTTPTTNPPATITTSGTIAPFDLTGNLVAQVRAAAAKLNIVVPSDLSVKKTIASGQFTGNFTGKKQLQTAIGTVNILPYDPRETMYEIQNIEKSFNNTFKTTAFKASPTATQDAYMQSYYQVMALGYGWSKAYMKWNI